MNAMGLGVAKIIKDNIPEAYRVDRATIKGDKRKLARFTRCDCQVAFGKSVNIINAYTQYRYGYEGRHFNYNALIDVMHRIKAAYSGQSILMVKIGDGTAGGDWPIVAKLVDHILGDTCQVTVIDY